MTFDTNAIELSLNNAKTGRPLSASVYDVTFDDGSVRTMSIGQLVMAICLERATQMESDVVSLMEEMANSSLNIDALSSIEQAIVDKIGDKASSEITLSDITGSWTVVYANALTGEPTTVTVHDAQQALRLLKIAETTDGDKAIELIEAKLDELNTNSQEQMIMLQSQTNKRDQSYEMISNVLKSVFTVMNGVVNNY